MKIKILQAIVPLFLASAPLFAGTFSNLVYIIIEDEISIIGTTSGLSEHIIIPNTITDLPVTSVKWEDVVNWDTTSITIPANVTHLITVENDYWGNRLGYAPSLSNIIVSAENTNYTSLDGVLFSKDETALILYPPEKTNTTYSVPVSVMTLDDGAFFLTDHLRTIHLPEGVQTIGKFAFFLESLETINFPSTLQTICDHGFNLDNDDDQLSIGSLTLPEGLLHIGDEAFNIVTLSQVSIPSSVTNIGFKAFFSYFLSNIVVSADNQFYSSTNGILFDKSFETLIRYPLRKIESSYVIPNSVTNISDQAFLGAITLNSIILPDALLTIGSSSFYRTQLTNIILPEGLLEIGDSAFSGTNLKTISVPSSVTNIAAYALNTSKLTDISVSTGNQHYASANGVLFDKKIETLIFYPAKKTGSYTIPTGVKTIAKNAFSSCSGLTSITIPQGLNTIPNYAFYGCYYLASAIFLGDAPTSVGNYIFDYDPDYSDWQFAVYFYEGSAGFTTPTWLGYPSYAIPTPISYATFSYNPENHTATIISCDNSITGHLNIPDSIEYLEENYLITSIENGAFAGCKSLLSISIPIGVTNIGSGCFANCVGLSEITLPENLTQLNSALFANCYSLQNIIIPSCVTHIDAAAFTDCYSLKSITIPANVESISGGAFIWCFDLKTVFFEGDAPASFGADVFAHTTTDFAVYFWVDSTGFTAPLWEPSIGQAYTAVMLSEQSLDQWVDEVFSISYSASEKLPSSDPDNDGQNNLAEYAFGTDPTAPDSPAVLQVTSEHTDLMKINFHLNSAATDLSYRLMYSTNLTQEIWIQAAQYTPRSNGLDPTRTSEDTHCSIIKFENIESNRMLVTEEIIPPNNSGSFWRVDVSHVSN